MQAVATKLAKNQFRCFQCRLVFAAKQGDWFGWNSMEVHLCRPCEKLTQTKPERNNDKRY